MSTYLLPVSKYLSHKVAVNLVVKMTSWPVKKNINP